MIFPMKASPEFHCLLVMLLVVAAADSLLMLGVGVAVVAAW